jgi:hypothetical protein
MNLGSLFIPSQSCYPVGKHGMSVKSVTMGTVDKKDESRGTFRSGAKFLIRLNEPDGIRKASIRKRSIKNWHGADHPARSPRASAGTTR